MKCEVCKREHSLGSGVTVCGECGDVQAAIEQYQRAVQGHSLVNSGQGIPNMLRMIGMTELEAFVTKTLHRFEGPDGRPRKQAYRAVTGGLLLLIGSYSFALNDFGNGELLAATHADLT
jgi:hypothetical protein